MTFNNLIENFKDMKPEAVAEKLTKALNVLIEEFADAPQLAVDLLESGFGSELCELEADDCFGTEGMRL